MKGHHPDLLAIVNMAFSDIHFYVSQMYCAVMNLLKGMAG